MTWWHVAICGALFPAGLAGVTVYLVRELEIVLQMWRGE